MAKRELSVDYRRGVAMADNLISQWREAATLKNMPAELHESLCAESGDVRRGMEECFAAFIRVILEGSTPLFGEWSALDELENPDDLYGPDEQASEGRDDA